MAQIGEPIRRHEVIPLKTEPVETPDGPKREVITPVEPTKVPEKVD
jgi:hypothetical protein